MLFLLLEIDYLVIFVFTENQVERQLLEHAGMKPDWVPWSAGTRSSVSFFFHLCFSD